MHTPYCTTPIKATIQNKGEIPPTTPFDTEYKAEWIGNKTTILNAYSKLLQWLLPWIQNQNT